MQRVFLTCSLASHERAHFEGCVIMWGDAANFCSSFTSGSELSCSTVHVDSPLHYGHVIIVTHGFKAFTQFRI